ncbi:hypothetical protein FSP39_004029 [Pinctada imbricata]|uniref:Uncharacterized protein n=1 Tax=Pinctada imbricata TaxID=66713 RepID=A0AA88YN02_PINIB|nr:hypothetical protein FSP39_004029 [Pinctada imbricata]
MSTETQSAGKTTVCTKNKEVDGYSKLAIGRKIDEENRIYSKNSSIYIKEHTKSNEKSKDGRVFDRAHACLFCGKLFTNIQVHLEKHTDERIKDLKEAKRKANIANYKEKPYLLREVKRLQNLLRAEGDHVHNLKVMENNSDELLVARRRKGTFDAHEYGPCPQCLEWIRLRDNYAKHRDTCSSKNGCATSVANVQQYIFEKRVSPEASIELKKEVFPSMMQDDITRIAMEDRLILEVGEYHFSSNFANKIKRKNYTSYRMRLAARLLTLLRKELNMPNASYLDLIKGEYFSAFVKCSIEACGVTDDEELKYPSTALKLGFDVSRLAGAKSCYGITNRKDELRNEADDFTKLVEKLWKVHVKKRAATLLEERQFNKKTELPLPDDVAKLAKYLVDSLKSLKLTADPAVFQRVVVLTEARLLLYNRRRPGELEAIRLSTYRKRSQGVDETDLNLRAELTKMEKTLLETQELLEIRGKCGKKVPVLLPLEVKDAMNYLADPIVRDKCGIQRDNPYIFANTRHLSVRAGNALNLVKYEIDLRRPDRILATNLRKHTATISQVMGLDDQQLKWLQRHMGHTERVHLQHYRATSGLIERIDIAKLMLLQEKNMVGRFAGLRLEDITFEVKRIPWTIEEVEEVKVYFKEYLEGTTQKKCPGMKECLHAIQNSKLKGTILQRRSWETLKKKVSHMMHAKK